MIDLIRFRLSQFKAYFGMANIAFCIIFTLLSISLPVQAKTVLVLGDSLSAGYGMSLQEAWPALLEKRLQKERESKDWNVINASISGETSEGGLRRLPMLLEEFDPDWLLLELGANDGLRGYPIPTISANLARMINMAQASEINVAILGIRIPPNYGARYSEPFFAQYAQLADRFNTQLVPFILEDVAIYPELMMADGLHPTVQAQPIVLNNVWRHINW
jgi:acyl-CoA thioesterase-1